MKVIKFPSIERYDNFIDTIKKRLRYVGKDENGKAIYDETIKLPKIYATGTIKLHGSNHAICYSPKSGIYIQTRKHIIDKIDLTGFRKFYLERKEAFKNLIDFIIKDLEDHEIFLKDNQVITLYGEFVGKNSQKKETAINQIEDSFFLFALRIKEFSIDENPLIDIKLKDELKDELEDELKDKLEDKLEDELEDKLEDELEDELENNTEELIQNKVENLVKDNVENISENLVQDFILDYVKSPIKGTPKIKENTFINLNYNFKDKFSTSTWLDVSNYSHKNFNIYNVNHFVIYDLTIDLNKPELVKETFKHWLSSIETQCPIAKEFYIKGSGEGIVFTTYIDDIPYFFKVHSEKFLQGLKSKSKKEHKPKDQSNFLKYKDCITKQNLKRINKFVKLFLTNARLEQFIDELKILKSKETNKDIDVITLEIKDGNRFSHLVLQDIYKEEKLHLMKLRLNKEEKKYMSALIISKTKDFFNNLFN